MGKNTNKPVHKSQLGGGGGGYGAGEEGAVQDKPFHSKEFEQAHIDSLLNAKERPSWDEFKEQQRKKGELEGAEARLEEEAQRRFRQELDEARNARLGAGTVETGKDKKKRKHKDSKKHKSHKEKKKKRRRSSGSSSDEDSESDERRKKKKSKKEKKAGDGKADGPVSLRAFFAGSSDESD